jgi:hypothetical protein
LCNTKLCNQYHMIYKWGTNVSDLESDIITFLFLLFHRALEICALFSYSTKLNFLAWSLTSKNAGKYLSALTFLENCRTIIDKAKVCINNWEDIISRKKRQISDFIKYKLDMLCESYGIHHCHQHFISAFFLLKIN